MGYYRGAMPRGDYYGGVRGDYYRGDPGFFSFIGKALKGIAGSVLGIGGGGAAPRALPAAAGAMEKVGPIVTALKKPSRLTRLGAVTAIGAAGAAGLTMGRRGRLVPAGGVRRHRRMNVTNPRALRRAIRRTHGFAKLAMRTIHLVHPKKKVRFGGFRKRRTKR